MTHWNTVYYNPCLNNMPYSIFCWHHYTIARVIYENHFIISLKEGRFGSHLTLIIIHASFNFMIFKILMNLFQYIFPPFKVSLIMTVMTRVFIKYFIFDFELCELCAVNHKTFVFSSKLINFNQ